MICMFMFHNLVPMQTNSYVTNGLIKYILSYLILNAIKILNYWLNDDVSVA